MRIIGGRHAGLRLQPPKNLPVRPTTDMAKEALFNILQNCMDFEGLRALDLFSGTGNVALELASRGALSVLAVDIHFKGVQYINEMAKKLGLSALKAVKADALKLIGASNDVFDFIFADPPYDLPQLSQIPTLVFDHELLRVGGTLVLEHPSMRKLPAHPNFVETRKYGYASFSFFHA